MAAYRSVDRLESIVKDIFNQSFQEFEIIVVDDLSGSENEEAVVALDNNKINYIKKYNVDKAFVGSAGIDLEAGKVMNFEANDGNTKKEIMVLTLVRTNN